MIEGQVSSPCPPNQAHINYSTNSAFYRRSSLQGYSLKYVLSGVEPYRINGQPRIVQPNQFVVVSHGSEVEVEIDSRTPVHGVCVFLSTHQIKDVWHTLQTDTALLLDRPTSTDVLPVFYEQVFTAGRDLLGQRLATLARQISTQSLAINALTDDLFYEFALHLCQQQLIHCRHLARLTAQKRTTREEVYRRLLLAREYVHDTLTEPTRLSDMAAVACLSDYHFLRSFKAVFGESPYQYVLRHRLQKAVNLLQSSSLSISEVAAACGFDEVQAFTKLFRKQHGLGPMRFRQLL
ncbi:hypothetical protein GCM10027341_50040 [Spirosoma knui]